MTSEKSLFQKAATSEDLIAEFPGAIFVEGWTANMSLARKWQTYGYVSVFAWYEDGLHIDEHGDPSGVNLVDCNTPYGQAIVSIFMEVQSGKLTPADYASAMRAVSEGQFETSPWAAYMPAVETE